MPKPTSGPSGEHTKPRRHVSSTRWSKVDTLANKVGLKGATLVTQVIDAITTSEEAAIAYVKKLYREARNTK